MFEKQSGYFVKTIAVGSGQAMAMGAEGRGRCAARPLARCRREVHGRGIRNEPPHRDAQRLRRRRRGRRSGRDQRAQRARPTLSRKSPQPTRCSSRAGTTPGPTPRRRGSGSPPGSTPRDRSWYQQTGLGMGQTLNVASEKKAYTLADRGTYLSLKKNLGLVILVEGDPILLNVYHVIQVNPEMAEGECRRCKGLFRLHGLREAQGIITVRHREVRRAALLSRRGQEGVRYRFMQIGPGSRGRWVRERLRRH